MNKIFFWQGYIFGRVINGNFVPQRVQNLVIRDYAEKNSLNLKFSFAEYYMDDCYMILQDLLQNIKAYAGLVFYSVHMLPDSVNKRKIIYDRFIDNDCGLFFALENLKINTPKDIDLIEDIYLAKVLSSKAVQNFHLDGS